MRRLVAVIFALAGCTFDATGLGEAPQTGLVVDSTVTGTAGPMSTEGATTTDGGSAGSNSLAEGSGGVSDATTIAPEVTTTEPSTVTTTTAGPGTTSEPCTMVMAYKDFDNDYYGDPSMPMMVCEGTQGWVPDNTDCNDMSANAHPGLTEVCDTIDNDCDGMFDEYDAVDNNQGCASCDFRLFDGQLYYFCHKKLEWEDAEQFCVSHGLHLVKDDGGAEHEFLLTQIGDTGRWWIGANDRMKEGQFKWVSDGSDVVGDLWGIGEPNDQEWLPTDKADCVLLLDKDGDGLYPGTPGKWNDHMCDDSFKFICEGPPP